MRKRLSRSSAVALFLGPVCLAVPSWAQTNFLPASGTNVVETVQDLARKQLDLAHQYFDHKKYKEALQEYQKYLAGFSTTEASREAVLFRIAESYRLLGAGRDAAEAYEVFCAQYSKSKLFAYAAVRLADLLAAQGKDKEAVPYYEAAALSPDNLKLRYTAWHGQAQALARLGREEDALTLYTKLAAAGGNFEKARQLWEKALQQRPGWQTAQRRLAELPARSRNYAAQVREIALRQQAGLDFVEGVGLFNQGRYQEAARLFAGAAEVLPNHPYAGQYLDLAREQARVFLGQAERAATRNETAGTIGCYQTRGATEQAPPGDSEHSNLLTW